jgi:hypothetical protein
VNLIGDELTRPDGGLARLPVSISRPGFDAAPYLTVRGSEQYPPLVLDTHGTGSIS